MVLRRECTAGFLLKILWTETVDESSDSKPVVRLIKLFVLSFFFLFFKIINMSGEYRTIG